MANVGDIRPDRDRDRGQATIYTAPELERGRPEAERTPRTSKRETGVLAGSSAFEVLCGAVAVVFSIIALAGAASITFGALSSILVGAGLVAFSGAVASRWNASQRRLSDRGDRSEVGMLGTEGLTGLAGIVLGVLALIGIAPTLLLCISAIALGAGVLLGGRGEVELEHVGPGGEHHQPVMTQALRGSAGFMALAGAGAAVLGILAVIGVGPALTMALVGMLLLGAGLVLGGAAAAFRFAMPMRRRMA